MKILIVANGYPTRREPQWGCFERDQALALKACGHKVIVMSVDGRFRSYWRRIGVSHIQDKGLDIYNIYWFPLALLGSVNKKWAFEIRRIMALRLYQIIEHEQGRPDILYTHFLYNTASVVSVKKKYEVPLVGMEHWSVLNQEKLPNHVLYKGEIAYGIADRIISVSESLRQRILYHFKTESVVIHNMIGTEFVNASFNYKKKRDKRLSYVTVGSLIYRKGFDTLIRAYSKANLKEEGVSVIIVGEGEERKALQQLIVDANLQDNIHLVGRKTKSEIISILDKSDVFILPSRDENFSVAVLEGLSAGLPVIATICGGIKECIDDKNGLLVPVDDVKALAIAMRQMYEDINKYDRLLIARECFEKYSPAVIAEKLIDVFEEVISDK